MFSALWRSPSLSLIPSQVQAESLTGGSAQKTTDRRAPEAVANGCTDEER